MDRSFGVLYLASLVLALLCSHKGTLAFSGTTSTVKMEQERPSQYYPEFFQSLPSMKGKTVVITGCSRGLGYVTALSIAKKGAAVIMLNRPGTNAQQAFQALEEEAAVPAVSAKDVKDDDKVTHYLVDCDLLDFESVRQACNKVQALTKDTGIDVLCNNAGIMLQPDDASADGYDITASTNMLSHFLITKELLPCLEQAAIASGQPSRVVSMSSASGYGGPALNPRFFEPRGGNLGGAPASYERYHQSKLANLAFTQALHDRLVLKQKQESGTKSPASILAVACTPGVCGTDMFVHATTVMNGKAAPKSMVPSTEDGAMAQLKCICDPDVQSGELWGPGRNGSLDCTLMQPPRILVDEISKAQLWDVCEQAVGKFEL
jgi:NAD(P)-dependent dehydrogenase (short-subunit alcohol dehydrogenase family)